MSYCEQSSIDIRYSRFHLYLSFCYIYIYIYFFFLVQQNKPLNSQNVADSLQKFNLKKAAIQKVLDALADSGQISFKEYGKQKIYLARQDRFDIPNSEELNRMKEENNKLQQQLQEQRRAISDVEGGTFCAPFLFVS
jgi:predicted transcriptional regulator